MTRAITLIALLCFLVVGVAATSILVRDGTSLDRFEGASPVVYSPVANREIKADRLAVVTGVTAAYEPPESVETVSEPLRQAYASASPADIDAPKLITAPASVPSAPPKPKVVSKPAPPKTYALLSDEQIAGIKERLKLSSSQESYWPGVESALRAVARKLHATRQTVPSATGAPPIDPDSEEVQQLKSAAMPLLFQLREDQKREVRALARLIGLEKVASMI